LPDRDEAPDARRFLWIGVDVECDSIPVQPLRDDDDPSAQEVEVGATVHLPLQRLQADDLI
jgi:hypothetical protein